MPGLIIKGISYEIQGLETVSWKDDPRLRLNMKEDGRVRLPNAWIRGIVIHSTKGVPGGKDLRSQKILPGLGTPNRDHKLNTAKFWSSDSNAAGAHLIVDSNGSVACCADLQTEVTYHATVVNGITIGIEIFQGNDAEFYQGQLDATVLLLDFLTAKFGIQRQAQSVYHKHMIDRIANGAADVVGIYGHRDVTNNRGEGDPGNAIFDTIKAAGYDMVDFATDQDKRIWEMRQVALGIQPTGVPGPETVLALKTSGKLHGMDVQRPLDARLNI